MNVQQLRELLNTLPEGMNQEQFDDMPVVYLSALEDSDGDSELSEISIGEVMEEAQETLTKEISSVFMLA